MREQHSNRRCQLRQDNKTWMINGAIEQERRVRHTAGVDSEWRRLLAGTSLVTDTQVKVGVYERD